ncbi:HpcH/HpaI aldolase/citrate lyase family protein [Vulgatibacter incomptus]|uniref:L-malyl-CoA/beta-methylmalyl-CoA lyase n=1 Tax=Vulgatibacter incomptus TaxID=1391653 RepID=A0A0K1PAD4_9BACT|nr:CoA ester lyase [Vulgatibacter incomptus]AKU90376.1 L-malyl-CoA/beta-methylmalyl-CoA lyase [Vulgatibacter incomptus]
MENSRSPIDQLVIARSFNVRRTELTCPAHSMKMMGKAADSEADEVILDLEDSCAVSQKVPARATLIQALRNLDFKGKIRAIRPNNVRTRYFYGDLIQVLEAAGQYVDVVVVPKVYGADDVLFVDRLITQIEENCGFEIGRIKLEVLIESAKALLHAEEIAACSPRMTSLIFGIADYAGDIGAKELTRDQFRVYHYPKAHTIAAARAAGIDVIDNVTLNFRDLEQVKRDAEEGARMGFDGKWAIHPSHLPVINRAYTPDTAEIQRALEILEAYRKADHEEGLGAIVYGDEMVDAATLRVEWKKLAVARRAGLVDEHDRLATSANGAKGVEVEEPNGATGVEAGVGR